MAAAAAAAAAAGGRDGGGKAAGAGAGDQEVTRLIPEEPAAEPAAEPEPEPEPSAAELLDAFNRMNEILPQPKGPQKKSWASVAGNRP